MDTSIGKKLVKELRERFSSSSGGCQQPRPHLSRKPPLRQVIREIPREVLQLPCTPDLSNLRKWLQEVAKALGSHEAREFGRSLDLRGSLIDEVIRDNRDSSREQKFQLLLRWYRESQGRATVENLIKIIWSSECLDDADTAELVSGKLKDLEQRILGDLEALKRKKKSGAHVSYDSAPSKQDRRSVLKRVSDSAIREALQCIKAVNIAEYKHLENTQRRVDVHSEEIGLINIKFLLEIQRMESDIGSLKNATGDLKQDIESEVGSLKDATVDLKQENSELKRELQTLRETLDGISQQKQQLELKVQDLLAIIENLSNEIGRLQVRLDSMDKETVQPDAQNEVQLGDTDESRTTPTLLEHDQKEDISEPVQLDVANEAPAPQKQNQEDVSEPVQLDVANEAPAPEKQNQEDVSPTSDGMEQVQQEVADATPTPEEHNQREDVSEPVQVEVADKAVTTPTPAEHDEKDDVPPASEPVQGGVADKTVTTPTPAEHDEKENVPPASEPVQGGGANETVTTPTPAEHDEKDNVPPASEPAQGGVADKAVTTPTSIQKKAVSPTSGRMELSSKNVKKPPMLKPSKKKIAEAKERMTIIPKPIPMPTLPGGVTTPDPKPMPILPGGATTPEKVSIAEDAKPTTPKGSAGAKKIEGQIQYYSYDTLKLGSEKDLPPDADRTSLEKHLSDVDFRQVFNMNRAQFYAKPKWKQSQLKKDVGLF